MGFEIKLVAEAGSDITRHKNKFIEKFGSTPSFYIRVPGRVNIIGEHIDYCGYGVLPMAIQPQILLTVGKSPESRLRLINIDNEKYPEFERTLDEDINIDQSHPFWWNYFLCGLKGAMQEIPDTSDKFGLDCIVDGSIPAASGLSSSSAVVVSAALALFSIAGKLSSHEPSELADLCAKAERFIGTQGGGMDQAIELLAVEGKAQYIQFNPIRTTSVELPSEACFVIANSLSESNKAAGSEFNQRVVECRLAAKILAKKLDVEHWKKIVRLIDVQIALSGSLQQMIDWVDQHLHQAPYTKEEIIDLLDLTNEELDTSVLTNNTKHLQSFKLYQRAYHVFSEAHRVEEYQRICATSKSLEDLGQLMYQSHKSCSQLYECSHSNLDLLVTLSQEAGAYGARLTGAGWGGCIVALVPHTKVNDYIEFLQSRYYTGLEKAKELDINSYLFPTKPGPGAQVFTAK